MHMPKYLQYLHNKERKKLERFIDRFVGRELFLAAMARISPGDVDSLNPWDSRDFHRDADHQLDDLNLEFLMSFEYRKYRKAEIELGINEGSVRRDHKWREGIERFLFRESCVEEMFEERRTAGRSDPIYDALAMRHVLGMSVPEIKRRLEKRGIFMSVDAIKKAMERRAETIGLELVAGRAGRPAKIGTQTVV
jgi:hypothetical protein